MLHRIYIRILHMIDSILTALQQPFFIRSLVMVILLASIFPLYGNIVVIRQEANIAHTFAHIALFGVAIWLWFNRPLSLCILWSVIVTVLYIYYIWRSENTYTVAHNEIWAQFGLVWAILLVSQMSGYKADISSYLFGDILLLWNIDLITISIVCVVCAVLYALYHKKRYALSMHHSLAISKWISVTYASLLYLIGLGILIWWAMKIVWVLLVSAFLILPSNIAKIVAKNTFQRNIIWVSIAVVCSIVALFVSWYLDMPSWASIVGCMVIVYGFMSLWSLIR